VSGKDIVVIGASAGGLEVLRTLMGGLPKELPASIFVVWHTSPDSPGILADVLNRSGALPATMARNGERIKPGRVYVAPPDQHLILEPGVMKLTRGPKENRFRPAVDPLFRSAAQVYGPRAIGVVLSGGLDDGTAGLWAIKQLGGTAIVQDPAQATNPSMPDSALRHVKVDHCVPVEEIAPLLARLTGASQEKQGAHQVPEEMEIEVKIAKEDNAIAAGVLKLGDPSSYACPECHGVLLELKKEGRIRFRCHTGHAYSLESLLAEIGESVEDSLWNAIRSIEEGVLLLRHLAKDLEEKGENNIARDFLKKAEGAQQRSNLVRQALMDPGPLREDKLLIGTEAI